MTSIKITPTALHDVVSKVKPLAGRDYILPSYASVHLLVEKGWLTALATDRYAAGIARVELPDSDGFALSLTEADWTTLFKLYPRPKRHSVEHLLTLTTEGERLTVESEGGSPRIRAEFETGTESGAAVRKTVAKVIFDRLPLEPAGAAPVAFNPRLLAKFAHLGDTMRVRVFEQHKPVLITAHNFVGVIMTMRLPDNRPSFSEDWATLSPAEQDAEAAA